MDNLGIDYKCAKGVEVVNCAQHCAANHVRKTAAGVAEGGEVSV
jgi:hypothetical protein